MNIASWRVLARAEVTRRLAHGDRYLETRLFLADGRVMEQVNPGLPDLENDWREVGRYADLRSALDQLRRAGWQVDEPSASAWAELAGLGATTLTFSLVTGLLLELWAAGVITFRSAPGFTGAFIPALALGVVVARALGGWTATRGAVLFGAAAATRLLDFVDLETLFAYSAIPAGVVVGVVSAEILGRRPVPLRVALEGAGVLGLAAAVSFLLDSAARLLRPVDPFTYVSMALGLAAAVGAGIVIAERSARPRRDAVILAGALLLIALVRLPTFIASVAGGDHALVVLPVPILQPALVVLAAWLRGRMRA